MNARAVGNNASGMGAAAGPARATEPALVVDLWASQDVGVVGGKAASLARAHAAGHVVPAGCVVTARGCAAGVQEIGAELARHVARLGAGPFAVRSSAVQEDGALRSWAGQLETVLSVPLVDVPAAVMRCVESASALHAERYGAGGPATLGAGGPGAVAVIVQIMVPATAAGVAFSADPRTGARGVTSVEAVRGLGDALVSGRVTPEAWRVDGAGARRVRRAGAGAGTGADADDRVAGDVLSPAQVTRVATLCAELEALFGAPQDVEWAFAGEALSLLQSRPITALPAAPIPLTDEAPPGLWQRDDHHGVMSPLGFAWFQAYPRAMAGHMRSLGMPLKHIETRLIRGQLYQQMVMQGGDGKLPPRFVLWLALRLMPSARTGERTARAMLDDEGFNEIIARWERELRPALRRDVEALFTERPELLRDDELLARIEQCLALCARGLAIHAEMGAPNLFGVGKLMLFVVDRLGWAPERAFELVAGASRSTTELHDRVAELVRAHAGEIDALAKRGAHTPSTWAELHRTCPELGAALAQVLRENRLRVLHYEPRNPTYSERPDILLGVLDAAIAARREAPTDARVSPDDAPGAALREAKALLDAQGAAELERLVAMARACYASRDANGVDSVSKPAGLLRWFVIELGRRIEDRIGAREHAVYLAPDEHARALRGELPDIRALIARRRGEESWAQSNRGPPAYGGAPPPPPPLDVFPPAMRRVMRIFAWMESAETRAPTSSSGSSDALVGVGLGHHTVTARARVIDRVEQLGALRHGEVLVCRITSPEWSLALGRVAAIVTDEGGALSHPAIIAREYGVTAVLGTGRATARIATGDTVRVDPVAGTVEVIR